MIYRRIFFVSLAAFIVTTVGCLGFVYISFRYFTYQGNGMDWIYTAGGFAVLIWMASAFCTVLAAVMMATRRRADRDMR